MNEPELGRLVKARAGRDKGKHFLIIGRADEAHVFIADGDTRKVARPKRKKLMHLHIEPELAEDIREKLVQGENVQDAGIRKALCRLIQEQRQD